MSLAYKTTANPVPLHKHVVDNDAEDASVTRARVYSGEGAPAPGHTVDSEAGWNSWWHANFAAEMERSIIPAVGDAMGMISKQLHDKVKQLHDRVAKLERELEQARADSVVTLPRSTWKHNAR